MSEVFARLYRRWQPGAIGDVDAYLRRAVVNEIGGEFRRRARRGRRTIPPTGTTATSTEDAVTERDRMWEAMLRLPPRQRAVLVLRYFDDASEARVAEILEVPLGTVKSTTARGLDGLRRILEGDRRWRLSSSIASATAWPRRRSGSRRPPICGSGSTSGWPPTTAAEGAGDWLRPRLRPWWW